MNDGAGWKLASSQASSDEATLHRLIAENPQLLPLVGSPRIIVLGCEVQLGNGYADILAVESSGRPTIIEVKLCFSGVYGITDDFGWKLMIPIETCGTSECIVMSAHHSDSPQGSNNVTILHGR